MHLGAAAEEERTNSIKMVWVFISSAILTAGSGEVDWVVHGTSAAHVLIRSFVLRNSVDAGSIVARIPQIDAIAYA